MDIKQMAFFLQHNCLRIYFVNKKSHCPKLFLKSLNYYSIQLVEENFLQVHTLAFHRSCENKAFLWILVAQRSIFAHQCTMNMKYDRLPNLWFRLPGTRYSYQLTPTIL